MGTSGDVSEDAGVRFQTLRFLEEAEPSQVL
jgi:hypothetical protein